jgi:uncharacterized membrane protein (DUF4010 family)
MRCGDMRVAGGGGGDRRIACNARNLHGLVKRMTWPELRSALVLLAMTFIALPVVPDDLIAVRRSQSA